MKICLGARTTDTVRIYFEKAGEPEIKAALPQKARTVEEALEDYRKTLLPDAKSYGKIIMADGQYIGDIWCYCIDAKEEPNAMLSYCIFEKAYWSQGIATQAVAMFLKEVQEKYQLRSIGAFTFSDNPSSIRVLEKNGFIMMEEFLEGGRKSKYFQYTYPIFDKHSLIQCLKELSFPEEEYWVVAGGAMVLHGFRPQTRDIDLGCSTSLADRLEQQGYPVTRHDDGTRKISYSENIEIFENWIEGAVEMVESVPVVCVDGLIQMKKKLGREKDLADIALIEKAGENG